MSSRSARPATERPVTLPPRKAYCIVAASLPPRAWAAVRTLARTLTSMPTAPARKPMARRQPSPVTPKARAIRIARTMAALNTAVYSRRRNATAPSRIAAAIVRIFSSPSSSRRRRNVWIAAYASPNSAARKISSSSCPVGSDMALSWGPSNGLTIKRLGDGRPAPVPSAGAVPVGAPVSYPTTGRSGDAVGGLPGGGAGPEGPGELPALWRAHRPRPDAGPPPRGPPGQQRGPRVHLPQRPARGPTGEPVRAALRAPSGLERTFVQLVERPLKELRLGDHALPLRPPDPDGHGAIGELRVPEHEDVRDPLELGLPDPLAEGLLAAGRLGPEAGEAKALHQ